MTSRDNILAEGLRIKKAESYYIDTAAQSPYTNDTSSPHQYAPGFKG